MHDSGAKTFPCSLGGQAKGLTIAAIVLGIPFLAFFLVLLPYLTRHTPGFAFALLIDALIGTIVLVLVGLTPRRYEIVQRGIVVRRRFGGRLSYPCDTIASVEVRRPSPLAGSVREGANGGLFGYNGYFSAKGIGTFEAHASTDETAVVLFRKKGDPVVLSPDDPERFAEELRARLAPA